MRSLTSFLFTAVSRDLSHNQQISHRTFEILEAVILAVCLLVGLSMFLLVYFAAGSEARKKKGGR